MKLKFHIINLVFSQWLCVTSKYHFPTLLPVVLHLVTVLVASLKLEAGGLVTNYFFQQLNILWMAVQLLTLPL